MSYSDQQNNRTPIYLISGLGADKRVFSKLELGDLKVVHLDWIEPLKNESLKSYAKRLSERIDDTQEFYLLGVSFGGVVAQEIAKILSPKKLFIISSLKHQSELPSVYKLGRILMPFVPGFLFTVPMPFFRFTFGVNGESWKLLKKIIRDQDPKFMRWAIGALLGWTQEGNINCESIRIHGTKDRVLPQTGNARLVDGGGHFMIYNRAEEVSVAVKSKRDEHESRRD